MTLDTTIKPQQWRIFFDTLSTGLSVREACRKSGISRQTAYRAKDNVDWIGQRWQEALLEGAEYLEDTAHERAVNGVTSTHHVYTTRGELIASHVETKYSDRLLLAMLGAKNPAYRQSASDQVQTRVFQELTRLLDLLQKKLPPDVYEMVIEAIATDTGIIDVDPQNSATTIPRIESGPSDQTGIPE